MSFDQTTIAVKKDDGTSVPMIAFNNGSSNSFGHAVLDNTGAIIAPATSGLQSTGNAALATMVTQTAGLATAAAQTTGNTSAATTATNTGNLDTNLGAKNDTAATTDTGTFSLIALFKRLLSTSTTMSTAHGAPADAAVTNPASSASMIAALKGILTACLAATPAGTNLMGKVGIDQTGPGTTNKVYLSDSRIVTGQTITRPADVNAYAAGDLFANSTTAGSVTVPTAAVAIANDVVSVITAVRLKASSTTLTNAIFRVHIYSAQPTVSNGDNGAWLTGTSGYCGFFDVTLTQSFSDSTFGRSTGPGPMAVAPVSGTQNFYYLIEVRAAYTPTSGETMIAYFETAQ